MQMIEADRQTFEAEQTNRINALKNYLDDRLRTAVCEYRKATDPDLYKVKAQTLQIEDHLQEIKVLANRVKISRDRFDAPHNVSPEVRSINDVRRSGAVQALSKVKGLVEAIQEAG